MSRKTRLDTFKIDIQNHLHWYPEDTEKIIELVLDKMSYNESCKYLGDLIKKIKKDNTQEIKITGK